MQKITQEEFEKMEFKYLGRYAKNPISLMLKELQLEEIIKINKEELCGKSPLATLASNMGKSLKRKFFVRTLADDSGWVVKRVA